MRDWSWSVLPKEVAERKGGIARGLEMRMR